MSSEPQSNLDPLSMRKAFGDFTTGVCVVTVVNDKGEAFGMTINSFASLSLDPVLLQWSIQNSSACFGLFTETKKFGISILSHEQESVSNYYANPKNHFLREEDLELTSSGVALIKGAITGFECDLWSLYPGGDHTIIVGEVTAMQRQAEGNPLLYFGGSYQTLNK